jgi:large subunit ribosomal protein L22
MEVTAITKNARMSPQKGRSLARKVQGLSLSEALKITEFSPRKAAFVLGKTLKSAAANATNNADLDVDTLRVKLAVFDEGPRMKRFWPRARGSASPILRRLCHVKVVLSDQT